MAMLAGVEIVWAKHRKRTILALLVLALGRIKICHARWRAPSQAVIPRSSLPRNQLWAVTACRRRPRLIGRNDPVSALATVLLVDAALHRRQWFQTADVNRLNCSQTGALERQDIGGVTHRVKQAKLGAIVVVYC